MSIKSDEILDTIRFMQSAFTMVMALALSESFKQFIEDKENTGIHKNRIPALLGFLFLIIPYFGGMSRYFFLSYTVKIHDGTISDQYGLQLLFDEIIFMFEAASFFCLSRMLSATKWRAFNLTLLILLTADAIWLIEQRQASGDAPRLWLIFDIIEFFALLILRYCCITYEISEAKRDTRESKIKMRQVIFSCASSIIIFIMTIIDYIVNWNFRFPDI